MIKKLTILLLLIAIAGGCGIGFLHVRYKRALRNSEQQRAEIQAAYEVIVTFHQANPDLTGEIVRRYQEFITSYPDSEQALLAQAQVQQLQLVREQAMQSAERDFKQAMEEQLAAGSLDKALAYAENYDGPFAADLKSVRDTYRLQISQQIKTREEAAAEVALQAQQALDEVMKNTAEYLYRFQFAEADSLLKKAASDPALTPEQSALQAFIEGAEPVCDMPQQICLSFLENMDAPVNVLLKSGEKTVRINDVDGTTVIADRVLYVDKKETGSTPDPFTFNDLSLREMATRIGKEKNDETLVMMALLFIQVKQYDKAVTALDASGSPLSPMLRELVESDAAGTASATARKRVTDPVFEPDEQNKLIRL